MIERIKQLALRLLRWSEKYTKTDMLYLTSGGFWLVLGYGGQLICSLILAVGLANLVPKADYGTYQFIISTSAIIGGLTLSGMGTALMRTAAQGARGVLRYAFKKQLMWSTGMIVASSAVALYYFVHGNSGLATAFFLIGICMPFLASWSLYRPYLEGKQLFRESTTLGLWRRPLPVIAVLIALLITRNPIILVITYYVSQTISMGLLYGLVVRRYNEPAQPNSELLNYSKHLSAMGIVNLVRNNLDNIIVFHFLGAIPAAVYTLAQLPYTHLDNVFNLGGSLIFPKFTQREFSTLKETLFHKVIVVAVISVAAVVAYIFAAPYIFGLLFPLYPEAVLLSQILILSLLAEPLILYSQAFAAHGMKNVQYFLRISTAVVKLGLLLILLPWYGLWGAVWATIAMSLYWSIAVAILFYTRKA